MPNGSLSELRGIVDEADKKFLEASKEKGLEIFGKCAEGFKILEGGANLIKNFGSASDKRAWNKIKDGVKGFLGADVRGAGIDRLSAWLKDICGNLPYSSRIVAFFSGAELGKIGKNLSAVSKKLPGVLKAARNTLSSEVEKKLVKPLSEATEEMGKKGDDFDLYEFLGRIVEFCSNLRSFCNEKGEMFEIMGTRERVCANNVNGSRSFADEYVDNIASCKGTFNSFAVGFSQIYIQFSACAKGSVFEKVVSLMKSVDEFMSGFSKDKRSEGYDLDGEFELD